jgi:excinuclease ABC subunit B
MKETIDITKKRRKKQSDYNKKNKITPKQIIKNVKEVFEKEKNNENKSTIQIDDKSKINFNIPKNEKEKLIREIRKQMEDAAKDLNFVEAAKLRDLIDIYKKGE